MCKFPNKFLFLFVSQFIVVSAEKCVWVGFSAANFYGRSSCSISFWFFLKCCVYTACAMNVLLLWTFIFHYWKHTWWYIYAICLKRICEYWDYSFDLPPLHRWSLLLYSDPPPPKTNDAHCIWSFTHCAIVRLRFLRICKIQSVFCTVFPFSVRLVILLISFGYVCILFCPLCCIHFICKQYASVINYSFHNASKFLFVAAFLVQF